MPQALARILQSRFAGFFFTLQTLTVVLNAPLGALRVVPGYLLHQPFIGVASDAVLMMAAVAVLNAICAAIITAACYAAERLGAPEDHTFRAGYLLCIAIYLVSTFLIFLAELPAGWLPRSAKMLIAIARRSGMRKLCDGDFTTSGRSAAVHAPAN